MTAEFSVTAGQYKQGKQGIYYYIIYLQLYNVTTQGISDSFRHGNKNIIERYVGPISSICYVFLEGMDK